MRIAKNELLAGIPVLKIRDYFRLLYSGLMTRDGLAERFNLNEKETEGLVGELLSKGYIEPADNGMYFNLGSEQINSGLSVQSMVDRVNPLGMYLNQETGPVWVGIPLRVHRRCLNPMFSISNQIAYDGKMVLATGNPKKINVQFENRFIHCPGSVEGKHWVPQQGELVKEVLLNEIHAIAGLPDVFVISPFSEVSFRLKGALAGPLLAAARKYIPGLSAENMWVWLKEHIGTVHTFQGKQAEGVILCLGLDEKSKGAARWASSKPNLLNVAVTRAKYRFVAIGDRNIWLNVPYFRELGKME